MPATPPLMQDYAGQSSVTHIYFSQKDISVGPKNLADFKSSCGIVALVNPVESTSITSFVKFVGLEESPCEVIVQNIADDPFSCIIHKDGKFKEVQLMRGESVIIPGDTFFALKTKSRKVYATLFFNNHGTAAFDKE